MALDVSGTISKIYTSIVNLAQAKAGVLITDGQDLALVLLLISLSWTVLQWLLSSDGVQALVEAFGTMARYAIVAMMLLGWLGLVGGTLQANVNDIAQKVADTHSINQSVDLMFKAATRMFSTQIADRMAGCTEVTVDTPDPAGGASTGQHTELQCPKAGSASWLDILVNFPIVIFAFLFKLIALVFLLLLMAAFLTVIFMAEVMFGIALTLGPILVPWLIWQRTEWLFDGWLRFTLSACFTKIVAFFMVGFVTFAIVEAKNAADAIASTVGGADFLAVDEMAALLIALCAAIGAFMMWQVPGIAQGLLSGSGGASAKGFGRGAMGKALNPGSLLSKGADQISDYQKEKASKGGGDKGGNKSKTGGA